MQIRAGGGSHGHLATSSVIGFSKLAMQIMYSTQFIINELDKLLIHVLEPTEYITLYFSQKVSKECHQEMWEFKKDAATSERFITKINKMCQEEVSLAYCHIVG